VARTIPPARQLEKLLVALSSYRKQFNGSADELLSIGSTEDA